VTTNQQYLPSSNILQTRFLHDDGVLNLIDFFPRPVNLTPPSKIGATGTARSKAPALEPKDPLRQWLVRRVECIRGEVDVEVNLLPAFNYARDPHRTAVVAHKCGVCGDSGVQYHQMAIFASKNLNLQLGTTIDCGEDAENCPRLRLECVKGSELGNGITTQFKLMEGQAVSFILRADPGPDKDDEEHLDTALIDQVQKETQTFWFNWISQSIYKGRWREVVSRSLLILKMLTFEPTGAIVAAPTFSLPEHFGGSRNWDYRFCWIRDSSFTIYILLRMGFRSEAEAYMNFISDRFRH
jgi:GH15 family glucan-1,4-alpha-glucosidase